MPFEGKDILTQDSLSMFTWLALIPIRGVESILQNLIKNTE